MGALIASASNKEKDLVPMGHFSGVQFCSQSVAHEAMQSGTTAIGQATKEKSRTNDEPLSWAVRTGRSSDSEDS